MRGEVIKKERMSYQQVINKKVEGGMDNEYKELNLRRLQDLVDGWIRKYGVRYFDVMTNMACLTEEVGEVAHVIARKFGEQSFKNDEREVSWKEDLGDELADVVWVIACLANQTGVDLDEAFRRNIEKKTKRDNERHKKNEKLTTKGY